MHALAHWARMPGRPVIRVATVDHGTRPEARAEAEEVARAAMRLGLAHDILRDPSSTPRSHAALRALRYRLLEAHARRIEAAGLLTAHTLDDQAETMLMRLASGSGIAGLAGMRPVTMRGGLDHVRPFLAIEKARLVATCRERGWSFLEDPGNADPRFARARWRDLAPLLAAEGLDAHCLARLAERARRADDALGAAARVALVRTALPDAHVTPGWIKRPSSETGEQASLQDAVVRLRGRMLAAEPDEIACRVLALALARGEGAGTPNLARLERCWAGLKTALAAGLPLRRTLAGQLLALDREGTIWLSPEGSRRRGRAPINDDAAAPPHSLGISAIGA
jgi:tRNA(Ile)-lysidine synthase